MKIINASYEILDELNGSEILKKIESIGRTCYKSESNITEDSSKRFVKSLIKMEHEAILEHFSFSVRFTVDRGISHELVRHRVASFAQESQRYCNYGKNANITFIAPCYLEVGSCEYNMWQNECAACEASYLELLRMGLKPEEARAILPNSTKTEIVMTCNLREWRHFFKLRALGTTGNPHPQMLEVTIPLLKEVQSIIPIVFDDLVEQILDKPIIM